LISSTDSLTIILSLVLKVITVSGVACKDWIRSTLIIISDPSNRVTLIIFKQPPLASYQRHRKREPYMLYHENTQNHVKKTVCIFISVGGQDILDPAMPVY